MTKALEGIKVVEIGAAVAMPIAGMLMGSWGAEVIHVEPPDRGDMQRVANQRLSACTQFSEINYLWEHVDRNKKSIGINLASPEGQKVIRKLCAEADVFLNNLRPYEMGKFSLTYETLSALNPRLIYANVTGYGLKGPEKNSGGYDSVAFWARSGVMEMMHDPDTAPNVSRTAYGDSITSLSLLAGVMTALFARERTGIGQQVEVSLYNTATWVLGFDITGCLITGKDAVRPQRKTMSNPIRNHYPTKDGRWLMLGMTNAQTYWPEFCKAINRPELETILSMRHSMRGKKTPRMDPIKQDCHKRSRTLEDHAALVGRVFRAFSTTRSISFSTTLSMGSGQCSRRIFSFLSRHRVIMSVRPPFTQFSQ